MWRSGNDDRPGQMELQTQKGAKENIFLQLALLKQLRPGRDTLAKADSVKGQTMTDQETKNLITATVEATVAKLKAAGMLKQGRTAREKTEELLTFAGLIDYRRRTVRHLSGGMKRKLMICRALMIEPEILLLDEPTAGMDALSRRQMWNLLRRVNSDRMTIVLTTHYIEEAQALCNRVALINQGRLQKLDTPNRLIDELGAFAVDETSDETLHSRYFHDRAEAIAYLSKAGSGAALRATTLEDVFVECAGRKL